jgi:hypothetical protein
MFQEFSQYLADHPVILGSLGIFVLLAVIGGWYVVAHHLHAVLVTVLCAAGFVSGILVLYRGYQSDQRDLLVVGAFLVVIFPLVYHQAIHVAKIAYGGAPSATAKGHARRAGA